MLMAKEWLKTWICLSILFAWTQAARPRFDVSTDMGMVLVPADAEIDTAIFRLRATDQDADFPLVFEIIATTTPVVRIENLPCTFYNKICQANVILTRRLVPGRLHDFIVRVRDSTGDMNSMQATISVTNATTPRDRVFPHLPTLVMVPEDTKPEKELDYLLVESNPWSGKPVYIELWQPKELFKIRQRQIGSQTKGIITLIGELDFETQSMYTLTMYATDPYTEPGKDTRNIAGINVVVAVVDVQDVPPIFTLAPPLTKINNTVKPGDVILRVHAEDGDKGVPREVTYGLISEGNPFTPFFNVSETTGEIILARPLEELTKITHVGAPIILKIVAEEIRTMRDEPPAQATVVELGLLLGEPGNSPPYFENDNYVAWIDENAEPGTIIVFSDAYATRVKDEDIGKAGVFALKLENNNGTFEISPAVAERSASFVITVRDNSMIDYEKFKSLRFRIIAQEVGPATNLSTSVPVTIFLRDMNDNPPTFDVSIYEVTLSENASAGTRVVQVHAIDKDAGVFGRIQYVKIMGPGSEAFEMNPDTGLITVSMGSFLDREHTSKLELTVEARDEDGRGLRGVANLVVHIIDINDNAPIFERGIYEFILNNELTNFTMPAFVKATDRDAEPPNNIVRYEIVHGNYDNKFHLNEITGQLMLRDPITKIRKIRSDQASNITSNRRKQFRASEIELSTNQTNTTTTVMMNSTTPSPFRDFHLLNNLTSVDDDKKNQSRRRRAEDTPLFILTARAYDLGVPHLSSVTQIRILRPMSAFARIVMFVMPGENPDPKKTAETLATITGSRVTIMEIKPYFGQSGSENSDIGKRSVVVARVEQNGPGTLVDVDKIRASLAENGLTVVGMDGSETSSPPAINHDTNSGKNFMDGSGQSMSEEEVTVYKAENKLLTWLLVLLGLLVLAALITIILCCVCSSCPFYMEPRKRRIHSSETLIIRSDGRPKRHLHRKPIKPDDRYYNERKEAWSADPERQQWQFNRRNTKNLGIASLPGDVHQNAEIERTRRATSLRQYDGVDAFGERIPRVVPMNVENERMYMEDMEAQRNFEQAEIDSLRRHELERGSDGVLRNGTFAAAAAAAARQERIREQHFYREGNAEVLRLVTRGEIEDRKEFADRAKDLYHANGKDILLQRFIEDQKLRRSQDLRDSFHGSLHEVDIDRSMESQQQQHQRANEVTEILILPERLEIQRQPNYPQRPQDQMINVDIQRLVTEHPYRSKDDDIDDYKSPRGIRASMRDAEVEAEIATSVHERNASFGMHDAELVRQNALLTRLLLEKEARSGLNAPVVDSSSFLETQSLPGQVAIATQTDRTASTQTECQFGRSRSDNEESEEDPRLKRKSKTRAGKFETKEDFKKMKTIWVRTPIPEESRAQSANKKTTPTRTKIEVTESRKVSISPDVLKEISNSLDSDNIEDEHCEVKRKVATKTISTKKVKESRVDDDSTTPSPPTKDKSNSLKNKIRKKPEKPPRKKQAEKRLESEKSHFMEPSFRVLEREISSFQQKIKEFGDKKLKILKKDDSKKEKDSEDDSGATYDVSKKCEVTVKRTTKSVSRETSPTKILVEQKSKTSGEEKKSQTISSSDLEDSDKSKLPPSTFSERTTQYESSRTETRSRSQLRRQQNLENSDFTKSSSEKIEESKSSSSDLKLDSSDFKKKQPQGKYLQSQRAATKRPVEAKRRVTAVKSKIPESKTKRQATTSDESKLSSPVKKSAATSEEDKSKAATSSSSDDKSKLSSAIGIDIEKLVEDVRVVVEKELQAAARETMNVAKSEESATDGKSEKTTTKSATKSVVDVQKSPTKVKSQSLDSSSKKEMTSMEKNRMQRSIEAKEKKEKSMKEKSKSEGSTSPTKAKTDEALTFVVFENDKIRRREVSPKASKSLDKLSQDSSKPREPMQSIEIISKPLQTKSEKDAEIEKVALDSIGETQKLIDSEIEKAQQDVPSSIGESKQKILEGIEQTENTASEKFEEAKQSISAIDQTKLSVSNSINETKRDISSSVEDIKQSVSNIIDDTHQSVSNEIVKSEQNAVQDSSNCVSDIMDEAKQSVSEKIDQSKQDISSRIDDTRQNVSTTIDETKENVSDKIEETKENISNNIEETKGNISDKIDETGQKISSTIDDSKESISKTIENTKQNISDGIEKTEETISNKIEDSKLSVATTIDETKQQISEKIEKTEETISSEIQDSKESVSTTIGEIQQSVSDAINETSENISNKVESIAQSASNAIEETKQNITMEVSDTVETITNGLSETTQAVTERISGTEKSISDKTCSEESTTQEATITNEKYSESMAQQQQSKSITSSPEKNITSSTSDATQIESKITASKAYLCESTSASLPSEMKEQEGNETITGDSKSDKESSSPKITKETQEIMTSEVTEQRESIEESTKEIERSEQSILDSTSMSESQKIEKTSPSKVNPSKIEYDKDKTRRSRSPTKLFKPIDPAPRVSELIIDDESDEDSSSASDISNKTALQTKPYRTPRHSMSPDGGGGGGGSTVEKKPEAKPRQRWDKEPLLKVEMPKTTSKANFPKKIEVATPINKPASEQTKVPPKAGKENAAQDKSTTQKNGMKETEKSDNKEVTRPTVVGVKRKDHLHPDRFSRLAETRRSSPRRETETHSSSRSSKVEIRSKHLKLQVSHHYRQPKDANADDENETASRSMTTTTTTATTTTNTTKMIDHGKEPEIANARSRYMAWYQQKRTEMERKRREKKEAEEEQTRTKWMKRPAVRSRKAKSAEDPDQHKTADTKDSQSCERAKSSSETAQNATTPRINRLRIRPLVNVESEQLKAIVRQGRKLRKKEGGTDEDLTVQIFAPEKPPPEKIEDERLSNALQLQPRHHLTQHSEYKYEKSVMPPALPFYLHPPPPPPNPSPEAFHDDSSEIRRLDDDLDSGIAVSLQGGTARTLKHQQVLEKKSVFDIAYSEAAPTQLRSDSSTPPS